LEFEGRTWQWCDDCFGGSWNWTHVTAEHKPRKGCSKNKRSTPNSYEQQPPPPKPSAPTPPPNSSSTNEANLAIGSDYVMDFV